MVNKNDGWQKQRVATDLGSLECRSLVQVTQPFELGCQGVPGSFVGCVRVNTSHFVGICFEIKQVPLVRFREVDQLVSLRTDAEVLWYCVFTQFVVLSLIHI